MANTFENTQMHSQEDQNTNNKQSSGSFGNFLSSQRNESQKSIRDHQQKSSRASFLAKKHIKESYFLRNKSSDKNFSTNLGSTGGSASQMKAEKPNLKLNTNMTYQQSIPTPQTTQNKHSAKMSNYYLGSKQTSQVRQGIVSTPKSQTQTHNIKNDQANSQHQADQNNNQMQWKLSKKGHDKVVNYNSFNSKASVNSDNGIARVGMSVPKTTTAANLKNFNNLRQFSQIFSQNKTQSNKQNKESQQQQTQTQKEDQKSENTNSNQDQNEKNSKLLQNHHRHIKQHSQTNSQQLKLKSSQEHHNDQNQKDKKFNFKNLQIAIPQSPRNEKGEQEDTQKTQKKQQIHQGCLSTTNANNDNIKVNKFTCNSTRNQNQKTMIFSQNEKQNYEKHQENQQSGETMQLQPAHKILIPNHETTKHSLKRNGVVRAYAANTNQGLVRNYNEDRVSIILNILKPSNRKDEYWPSCSFFGIYDGHGGSACADFLRDNLHQFVIKESCFPSNPKEAILIGFQNAEKKFLQLCQNENGVIDKSGSCAIVVLIVEDMCYVANVGDSRAILSSNQGSKIYPLSRDHKPNDELERKRIIEAGGQIYHRTATQNVKDDQDPNKKEVVVGPLRVLPGRLSVSRTFGDVEAKQEKNGGNPKVVTSDPEIKSFKITKEHDFVVLGCDGIFDKLSNSETANCVWNSVKDNKQMNFAQNIHKQSAMGVEYILKNSLLRRSLDNVTVVMISFSNFKHAVFGQGNNSNRQGKANQKGVNDNSFSQISTDNSYQKRQNEIKKENIPPYKDNQQTQNTNEHSLKIQTNQNTQPQGLKTTTNAQAKQNNQVTNKNDSHGHNSCVNGGKSKHFDFSNV